MKNSPMQMGRGGVPMDGQMSVGPGGAGDPNQIGDIGSYNQFGDNVNLF